MTLPNSQIQLALDELQKCGCASPQAWQQSPPRYSSCAILGTTLWHPAQCMVCLHPVAVLIAVCPPY